MRHANDVDTVDLLPLGPITDAVRPPAFSSSVQVDVAGLTDQGKVRANNEDHFLIASFGRSLVTLKTNVPAELVPERFDETGYALVVADGMGGAAAGERASALAVESVKSFALNTLKWFLHLGKADESALVSELRKGLELADQAVFDEAESNARFYGMGTTLTMAYSVGHDLYIVHAGDSRAYLFREGNLEQITSDHTLVQLLVSGGVLSPEDAKTHARRNVVTNVIGPERRGTCRDPQGPVERWRCLAALLRWPNRAGLRRENRRDARPDFRSRDRGRSARRPGSRKGRPR
jgi:serine/threonine protein phosphatase PrpC